MKMTYVLYIDYGTGEICDGVFPTREDAVRDGERQRCKGGTKYRIVERERDEEEDLFPGQIPAGYDGPLANPGRWFAG